jgi:hypothetical protein
MIDLAGECVCGFRPPESGPDCERCRLVKLVRALLRSKYDHWYDRGATDIAAGIAEELGLRVEDVRAICEEDGDDA